jgi:hypothetical protein
MLSFLQNTWTFLATKMPAALGAAALWLFLKFCERALDAFFPTGQEISRLSKIVSFVRDLIAAAPLDYLPVIAATLAAKHAVENRHAYYNQIVLLLKRANVQRAKQAQVAKDWIALSDEIMMFAGQWRENDRILYAIDALNWEEKTQQMTAQSQKFISTVNSRFTPRIELGRQQMLAAGMLPATNSLAHSASIVNILQLEDYACTFGAGGRQMLIECGSPHVEAKHANENSEGPVRQEKVAIRSGRGRPH